MSSNLDILGQVTRKDPDAGKDWGWEEKGVAEDEMVRHHHQYTGHEFELTLGGGEGQRSLTGCSLWGYRVKQDLATDQQQQLFS